MRALEALAIWLLPAAVLLAYLPAVLAGLGFVSDDFMILERIRRANGLAGAMSFFGQSYYDYYRPVGFVSFAADWTLWQRWPAGYHATSILLHLINTVLVFVLARRLGGAHVAAIAAAIFGLHVANQEAVFWASARFDLLATAGSIASLLMLGSSSAWRPAAAALLYLAALLSKESAVALPVAAGAYLLLIRRERASGLMRTFAWLGAAGLAYVLLRQSSGLEGTGGASRIPKLVVLVALPLLQLACAHPSTASMRRWLLERRNALMAITAVGLIAAGGAALLSDTGSSLRDALGALGFASVHLLSPICPEPWLNPLPGWLAAVGLLTAVALALGVWRLAGLDVPGFLFYLLLAALLPVSSMTEGSRYLYFASVPVAIFSARAIAVTPPRLAAPAYTVLMLALIVFGWQVRAKGRDWLWASEMTSRAVATVANASGPGCRDAHVVLATAPVRTRGVYSNINHEALATLGDCRPASLRTIIRTGYEDPDVEATLQADRLMLRVGSYRGGFLASADFQRYATRIEGSGVTRVTNGFGPLDAVADRTGLVITQHLSPGAAAAHRWFVFGHGSLHSLQFSR